MAPTTEWLTESSAAACLKRTLQSAMDDDPSGLSPPLVLSPPVAPQVKCVADPVPPLDLEKPVAKHIISLPLSPASVTTSSPKELPDSPAPTLAATTNEAMEMAPPVVQSAPLPPLPSAPTVAANSSPRYTSAYGHAATDSQKLQELIRGSREKRKILRQLKQSAMLKLDSSSSIISTDRGYETESESGESDDELEDVKIAEGTSSGISRGRTLEQAFIMWRMQWLALRIQEVQQRIDRATKASGRKSIPPAFMWKRDENFDGMECARTACVAQSKEVVAKRPKLNIKRSRGQKRSVDAGHQLHFVLSSPNEVHYHAKPPPSRKSSSSVVSSPSSTPTTPKNVIHVDSPSPRESRASSPRIMTTDSPFKLKLYRSKSVCVSSPDHSPSPKRTRSSSIASPITKRTRSCSNSFDINHLVIPENMMQPNAKITPIEYKEIETPTWRITSNDNMNVCSTDEEEEDTGDELYLKRHRPLELLESKGQRFDVLSRRCSSTMITQEDKRSAPTSPTSCCASSNLNISSSLMVMSSADFEASETPTPTPMSPS